MSTSFDTRLCRKNMVTSLGTYKGFALYLRVPLLVQDDTDYDESSAEVCERSSSKYECYAISSAQESQDAHASTPVALQPEDEGRAHANFENLRLQSDEERATETEGSFLPLKCNCSADHRRRRRTRLQAAAPSEGSSERDSAESHATHTESHTSSSDGNSSISEPQQAHVTHEDGEQLKARAKLPASVPEQLKKLQGRVVPKVSLALGLCSA